MKPDGTRRIVLAYLSIGEAESYRNYWQSAWYFAETKPKWLREENPNWPRNYLVDFGDPDWQAVMFGTPFSMLDRIAAAGFDGVYLDRVDAYQDAIVATANAEDQMVGFVGRLADHAHRINPNFLVIMQNAEELAKSKPLLARLDGLAKEDFLFGFDNSEAANPTQMIDDTLRNLRRARRAGLKIFVLEYAKTAEAILQAQRVAARERFVLHITDRMLGMLSPLTPISAPSASTPAPMGQP